MVSLTIDSEKILAEDGATVLETAGKLGIKIPTLCYHKALAPYGACRLCVVEVVRRGRSRLVTACTMPVEKDIEVKTNPPRVQKARQLIMELLLARCPTSKELRDLAHELGVERSRFKVVNPDEKCILCGLCYRVCADLMKTAAIGVAYRGGRRLVTTPFAEPSETCMVCGACAHVCPTGMVDLRKISGRDPLPIPSEFDMGLAGRAASFIPFPQAVPNLPRIDPQACMYQLRRACQSCIKFCSAQAIDYHQVEQRGDIAVGAVVLAPGYELFDAAARQELGYGRYKNVLTSLEFERVLSASGPFRGKVVRPSDGAPPRRIAFIQCVGCREVDHNYCSSVCCMYATKEAIIAKEHEPDVECAVFYIDLRAFGKGFDAYYERAQKAGVRYIRCRPSSIKEVPASRNLKIKYEAEDGKITTEEFDLVVLSAGIRPSSSLGELARRFSVALTPDGFCRTDTFHPVETSRSGVFACGPFTEPKDIPETVMQASAAAARALAVLHDARGTQIRLKTYPPEKDVAGQEPRLGVFICHCGANIAGVVDVPSVVEYARTLPGVVHAENNLYTCSNDTQERIKKLIAQHDLNRVVVASCSPRTHEPLFRNTMREAGLNPYLFEMANIRDQCSWVHMHEPRLATRKARDLVRMAVAKSRLLEPLARKTLKVNKSALVIGGGVSGLVAARHVAEAGFEVYLVERDSELGGNLRRLRFLHDGVHPQDGLRRLIRQVTDDGRIHIRTGARIKAIEGFIGSFKTRLVSNGAVEEEIAHGAVIVATGAQEAKPSEYLYGKDARVLTQTELEEKWGQVPAGRVPGTTRRVVMIQCVGSREKDRAYCSRVCCAQAVKNALKIKEDDPAAAVAVLYRDVRTYGFREADYRRAREMGVVFLRYSETHKPRVEAANGALNVIVREPVLGKEISLPADLLVLSPAIVPDEGNKDLAQMLKVPLTQEGFFLEAHMKLRPVDFATDGVFVCGLAHSPKSLQESIAQAGAAAGRACTILSKDEIELEATLSEVVDENCDGCAYCIDPCPYKAITLLEYMFDGSVKKTVEVNESACKGCGVCQATCPKKGIFVRGFKLEQIAAQVVAALEVS